MGWSWDRVGFRVVGQLSPQQEIGPNLTGYGVTYGDIVIHNEYGVLRGLRWRWKTRGRCTTGITAGL